MSTLSQQAKSKAIIIWIWVTTATVFCQSNTTHKFYFIGDAGQVTVANALYRTQLQQQLNSDNTPSTIIFLGDNIYPKGMPDEDSKNRATAEAILKTQIDLVNGANRKIIFVPGNHDWKRGESGGWDFLRNQQAWIDSIKDENVQMIPLNGCPGPEEISINESLTLVILDTQWMLHPWEKPDETSSCECKTQADVFIRLADILERNKGKRIVVAGHHPVVSNGEHGGYYSFSQYLALHPIYRKFFGSRQDFAHPQYKVFRKGMHEILKKHTNAMYFSGHDHSLQHLQCDSIHYIISGSGSKTSHVKKIKANFSLSDFGFVQFTVHANTQAKLDFITSNGIQHHQTLKAVSPASLDTAAIALLHKGSIKTFASSQYRGSSARAKWFGENYRQEWQQPLEFPVFDIGQEKGGLKILQRGGGNQTLSLRLRDSLGHEYSMRSIEKFPEKALPSFLRKTFAEDFVQDQISASHPYGALVVPYLAESAGIYHTNPKVFFMPNDARLGVYRKDFANRLMLFEERADGKGKGLPFFGNPDKMVNTTKLLEQLEKDKDNKVDELFFLRARLFDLWIGDWDRHEDQWRWGEFNTKNGKLYRPIPRDRDQAFFLNEGIVPRFLSQPFLLFRFEGFREHVRWPSGLLFSGRYIDRKFLTALARDDWKAVADDLVKSLSDSVIEASIKKWPKEIYDLHGAEIIRNLKLRRDDLRSYTLKHYEFLARTVSVVGSDKAELFEIERKENGNLDVHVFRLNKNEEKGKDLYHRTFYANETKELRLYGLGAKDKFVFTGKPNHMKVRVIGGKGDDEITALKDNHTILYDSKKGYKLSNQAKIRVRTGKSKEINEYNWRDFKYNVTMPLILANYNVDDGVFLGGGVMITKHGFRKEPFQSKQVITASYALNTSSYNFSYSGAFTKLLGKWNLELDADIKAPNFVNNFFGWGNESVFDKRIDQQGHSLDDAVDFYRVRFKDYKLHAQFSKPLGEWGSFKVGPQFQHIALEHDVDKDRFINQYPIFKPVSYGGVQYSFIIDKRNNKKFTTRGAYIEQTSRAMKGNSAFTSNNLAICLYQSFKTPSIVTFAVRAGGGINTGKYDFFLAQVLDGRTELRGFRKTRFYGNKKFYVNNEMRIKLGSVKSYLFPAHFGLLGFYDVGRVWYEDGTGKDPSTISGKSNVWHKGWGGGIWFTPFNLTAISIEASHSKEGILGYFRLGFLF